MIDILNLIDVYHEFYRLLMDSIINDNSNSFSCISDYKSSQKAVNYLIDDCKGIYEQIDENELLHYLYSLDDEAIKAIIIIMYFGRSVFDECKFLRIDYNKNKIRYYLNESKICYTIEDIVNYSENNIYFNDNKDSNIELIYSKNKLLLCKYIECSLVILDSLL